MPKVSIIIPVYNVEKYLRECLDSVVAQTLTDWECICVDDGSTDSSLSILTEYAAKDSRFRVIKHEHSNAGACRNVGMDLASGKYLSFLDADDFFAPHMLEILVDAAERTNSDISSCYYAEWNHLRPRPWLSQCCAPRRQKIFDAPSQDKDIFSLWGGMAWDKLFRRDFIEQHCIRYQEIRWTNDFRFVMLAVTLAQRIVQCPVKLLAYRRGHTSLQSTKSRKALCFYEAISSYRDMAIKLNCMTPGSLLEKNFKRFFVNFTFHHMDAMETAAAYEEVYQECCRLCKEWYLKDLKAGDFENCEQEKFSRFEKILAGYSALESLWHYKQMLRAKMDKMISRDSMDYRLGHALLALPRLVKRILLGQI